MEGGLVHETVEVLFQRTRHFPWAPGARAIDEPLRALVGKAVDPLAQGGIGKLERVGNGTGSVKWGYFPLLQQELRRFECSKVHAQTPSKR